MYTRTGEDEIPAIARGFSALGFQPILRSQEWGARADLVDDTCINTYSPVFCTLTLTTSPGSSSADAKVLACIMLQVVQTNSNIETFDQVENLLGRANRNNVFSEVVPMQIVKFW